MELRIVIIALLITCSFKSISQNHSICESEIKSNLILADILKVLGNKVLSSPNSYIFNQQFFKVFPCNFEKFNLLYGYSGDSLMPLYSEAYSHLFKIIFGSCEKTININTYYKKIIKIGVYGKWYSDAVGYFQHNLNSRLLPNIEVIINELNYYSNDEIYSFWKFCFDGPHPEHVESKKLYENLHKKMLNLDIHKAELLKKHIVI